jgi:hypothetical protein
LLLEGNGGAGSALSFPAADKLTHAFAAQSTANPAKAIDHITSWTFVDRRGSIQTG